MSNEQRYILNAIEGLRNEMLARFDKSDSDTKEIKETLSTLGSTTANNTTAIAKLNLVVFGMGAAVGSQFLKFLHDKLPQLFP